MSDPRDAKRIEQMQERLDKVEKEIEEARREAEKVLPKEGGESFTPKGAMETDDGERPPDPQA